MGEGAGMRIPILLVTTCIACGPPRVRNHETCTSEERSTFAIDCIRVGTPTGAGDYEDPERLVYRCAETAKELVPAYDCTTGFEVLVNNEWVPCSDAAFGSEQRKACRIGGWKP